MSNNGVKTALRALFKKLWAILGFSETRDFTSVILTQKIYFDPKMASNLHMKSDFGHFFVDFWSIWPKKSILSPKSSKNINVQKWCKNGSTAIILEVMSNFRFFKNPPIYHCNFEPKMASNPQLKSYFGHISDDFWSILRKKSILTPKSSKNINVQ